METTETINKENIVEEDTPINKVDIFKNELILIKNQKIREFTEKVIETLPDYFFSIPASSTGKYHPAYTLGKGGVVRHTRAAVRIAVELSRLSWWKFINDELDLCLAALFIHDGYKSGIVQGKYTVFDHPNIIANIILENENFSNIIPREQIEIIASVIKTHMGQWCYDKETGITLDVPETKLQKFVHLADYLASRKCLEMNLDVELSKP